MSSPDSLVACRHCGAVPSVDTSERDANNLPFLDHPLNGCYYGGWHLAPRMYQDACAPLPNGPRPEEEKKGDGSRALADAARLNSHSQALRRVVSAFDAHLNQKGNRMDSWVEFTDAMNDARALIGGAA